MDPKRLKDNAHERKVKKKEDCANNAKILESEKKERKKVKEMKGFSDIHKQDQHPSILNYLLGIFCCVGVCIIPF